MKFKIIDHGTMTTELSVMDCRSFLIVGNHVEPQGVHVKEEEYVVVINGNANKIPPTRMNMVASFQWLPGDQYPCSAYLWTLSYPSRIETIPTLGREVVFLIDHQTVAGSFKVLGYPNVVHPPGPTTGFSVLNAFDKAKVPVRVVGFSWYMEDEESKIIGVGSHDMMKERAHARIHWLKNPLFTFSDECLKYLSNERSVPCQ